MKYLKTSNKVYTIVIGSFYSAMVRIFDIKLYLTKTYPFIPFFIN
jgi:hypothetical protein